MAWTKPRTWVPGEMVTAALLNTYLRDNIREVGQDASVSAGWNAYTPQMGFTLGNATVVSGYRRIGRALLTSGSITFGSTTTQATQGQLGGMAIPIPHRIAQMNSGQVERKAVPAILRDASARDYVAQWEYTIYPSFMQTETTVSVLTRVATTTNPVPWTTSDSIVWHGFYEAAD